MNYEKFKRSDRPDRFRSLTTVNDFLSVVGEKFFNDYLQHRLLFQQSEILTKIFGMNNQLTLPRTQKLFYFKIISSYWIETSDDTLHSEECKRGPWMNKFPKRGRYQIANIRIIFIVHNFPLRPWFLTILIIKS
jgi:hypothetical protein